MPAEGRGLPGDASMDRRHLKVVMAFACALVAAQAGSALAQPAYPQAQPSAKEDAVGPDVIAAGRSWIAGDKTGRERLETLARSGRSDAEEMLGEVLGPAGPVTLRDEVAGCGWFAKAATMRRDALHNLAHCAEKGVGGDPDFARAATLYAQASARGYPQSMCALGNLYIAGHGVAPDAARGAALCRQGADLGERNAETDLGNLYLQGVGVPHDMVQARHWYELAAAQGQPNAEFVLGQIYWNGDDVPRDQAKAAELWKSAYSGGRADAAALLANWTFAHWMAAHSKGDTSGLDEAIAWEEAALKVAANNQARAQADHLLNLMRATRQASATQER
jgi:TPR repeat protein